MNRDKLRLRVREHAPFVHPGADQCECCDAQATHWVRWQSSPFRTDDEVYGACSRHLAMALDDKRQTQYWAHMDTKGSFLRSKATRSANVSRARV